LSLRVVAVAVGVRLNPAEVVEPVDFVLAQVFPLRLERITQSRLAAVEAPQHLETERHQGIILYLAPLLQLEVVAGEQHLNPQIQQKAMAVMADRVAAVRVIFRQHQMEPEAAGIRQAHRHPKAVMAETVMLNRRIKIKVAAAAQVQ